MTPNWNRWLARWRARHDPRYRHSPIRSKRGRTLEIEALEDRTVPAGGLLSLEEAVDKVAGRVSGVTVITHGFQPTNDGGDSLVSIAQAIQQRTNGWLLNYTIPSEGGVAGFNPAGTNPAIDSILPTSGGADQRELVILYDWAAESNELSSGWTTTAGDALFSMVVRLGLVDLAQPQNSQPFHFIAHSFGSAVTSEAVRRLGAHGVEVDQVTYLGPHDFDQPWLAVDEDQAQASVGQPAGYGASVWSNVRFADVYYQTRGENGALIPDIAVPNGRPIPGAYNRFLDQGEELPASGSYEVDDAAGDHSFVWNTFYLSTILGGWDAQALHDLRGGYVAGPEAPAVKDELGSTGYAFSRAAAGQSKRAQAAPNFYSIADATPNGPDKPHAYSNPAAAEPAPRAVLELDPHHARARRNLEALYRTTGRWVEGVTDPG